MIVIKNRVNTKHLNILMDHILHPNEYEKILLENNNRTTFLKNINWNENEKNIYK